MLLDNLVNAIGLMKKPEGELEALKVLGLDQRHLIHLERALDSVRGEELRELESFIFSLKRFELNPGEKDDTLLHIINDKIPDCSSLKSFCDALKEPMNKYRKVKKNSWKSKSPRAHLESALKSLDNIIHREIADPQDLQLVILQIYFACHNLYMGRDLDVEVVEEAPITVKEAPVVSITPKRSNASIVARMILQKKVG